MHRWSFSCHKPSRLADERKSSMRRTKWMKPGSTGLIQRIGIPSCSACSTDSPVPPGFPSCSGFQMARSTSTFCRTNHKAALNPCWRRRVEALRLCVKRVLSFGSAQPSNSITSDARPNNRWNVALSWMVCSRYAASSKGRTPAKSSTTRLALPGRSDSAASKTSFPTS